MELVIKPTPYISVPQGYEVKDHKELQAKIRNKIIDAYVRSQAPMHIPGWVCYEVQPDHSLVVIDKSTA